MKRKLIAAFLSIVSLVASTTILMAQVTSFTYQGFLTDRGAPANGAYDLQFNLYSVNSGGSALTSPIVVSDLRITNGLFSVSLNFGSQFAGSDRWLEIGFRSGASSGFFTNVVPRQVITAVPYAMFAPSAGTAGLASSVPANTITASMIADGAVTASKIAAGVIPGNLTDGGSGAYSSFVESARAFTKDEALPFTALLPVTTVGGTPSLTFYLNGSSFGTMVGCFGREAISEPYSFVVEVIAPSPSLDPDAQFGLPARVSFNRYGRNSSFAGIVTGCALAGYDGTNVLYTFRLEPPLANLARWSGYRIFQELAVPDIVQAHYSDTLGLTLVESLSGSYPTRAYAVQYAETHLNFFNRLLEEEGIFYYFRQSSSNVPTLTLGDAASSYVAAPYSSLPYYGNVAADIPAGTDFIRSFHKAQHQSTFKYTVAGYDFNHPSLSLYGSRHGEIGIGEKYEFGTSLIEPGDLESRAQVYNEREDVEHQTFVADGNAADLRPGYKFTLEDNSGAGFTGDYVVTAVRHAAFRRLTNGNPSYFYGNQLEVVPYTTIFRPERKTPKPVARPCTATVVGPAGEEIYVDSRGRVKVQFRWDREGSSDANSSCWIRTTTPWSGIGWGAYFVPRMGQEVLVDFLYGDPDQPIITGNLYNATHPVPYALPAEKTKSGIKSQSSKGGSVAGGNELRFEDKKGSEELYLHGEKNMNIVTEYDFTHLTGHDFTQTVDHDWTSRARHDFVLQADNSLTLSSASIRLNSGAGLAIGTTNNPAYSLSTTGAVAAAAFRGDGSAVSNLSAAAIATGTLSDSRLSANVALRTGGNVFTGTQNIFSGSLRMNDQGIFFRGGSDIYHGLGWVSAGSFGGANPDGPVLFGCGGGGLGTLCSSPQLALAWNNLGNVWIDPHGSNNGALTPGLLFGSSSSTEGIGSKRTSGGNQYGLDFYTSGSNRVSIANSGNVGIGTSNPTRRLHVVEPDGFGGGIQVGGVAADGIPKLINFGDGDYVHIGENGADDRLELKAGSFYFSSGSVGIGTTSPTQKLHVVGGVVFTSGSTNANQSVSWSPGNASWNFTSDRNAKANFKTVDDRDVLERVSRLPLSEWSYLGYPQRHIGPMAQDFHELFPLSQSATSIDEADLHGVALAAIRGVNQKLDERSRQLEAENAELKRTVNELKRLVDALVKKTDAR